MRKNERKGVRILSKTNNDRSWKQKQEFLSVNEIFNINGDEKTAEKNAVEDLDQFNSFFATIGANLAKECPSPKLTERAKQMNSIIFRTIDEKEVTEVIAKKKDSTDCYKLNYVHVKTVPASVSPVLTMLFSTYVLRREIFRSLLK